MGRAKGGKRLGYGEERGRIRDGMQPRGKGKGRRDGRPGVGRFEGNEPLDDACLDGELSFGLFDFLAG